MVILSDIEIKERIKNPLNRDELSTACKMEQELLAFCSRKENQEYILQFVEDMVVKEKYDSFKKEYLNATVDIIDNVRTQYKKVFNAHERNINFEFDDPDAQIEFINLRKVLYNGISDNQYFEYSTEIALYKPHNILFIIPDEKLGGQPNVMEYRINKVWDIECSNSGIEFIIFKEESKETDETTYFGCDSEKYFSITKKQGLIIAENYVFFETFDTPPATWVWNYNLPDTYILKKSILYDSLSYLYDYSVTWNGNAMYKRGSAYPTEFYAKALQKEKAKDAPHKSNSNIPTLDTDDFFGQSVPNAAFIENSKPKDPKKLGTKVELDVLRMNPDKLDAYIRANFRLESDKDILLFHAENIEKQRIEILEQICGKGFGQSTTREAINVEQVMMNFDSQESNLDKYRDIIQQSWKYANEIAAKIFSTTYEGCSLWLGDEYFLRSIEQLGSEVEQMKKAGYPQPDIFEKINKIRLTQNKHNPSYLKRSEILVRLQPLQNFDAEFIRSQGQYLQNTLPREYTLYVNFQTVVDLFEQQNGKINQYKPDEFFESRVEEIRRMFYEINRQLVTDNQNFVTFEVEQTP